MSQPRWPVDHTHGKGQFLGRLDAVLPNTQHFGRPLSSRGPGRSSRKSWCPRRRRMQTPWGTMAEGGSAVPGVAVWAVVFRRLRGSRNLDIPFDDRNNLGRGKICTSAAVMVSRVVGAEVAKLTDTVGIGIHQGGGHFWNKRGACPLKVECRGVPGARRSKTSRTINSSTLRTVRATSMRRPPGVPGIVRDRWSRRWSSACSDGSIGVSPWGRHADVRRGRWCRSSRLHHLPRRTSA